MLRNYCIFSFLWWVDFLNKLGVLRTWTPHVTRRSAFFELSHPRTHIFHVHNAITACLTQLSMNFDWFHATQVEESDNHALFFECKIRHFSIKNTTATRPPHKHSTGSTVLPLGLAQPKEQPRLLQQLSRFYLLPFLRKKLGYIATWTPHVDMCRRFRKTCCPHYLSRWNEPPHAMASHSGIPQCESVKNILYIPPVVAVVSAR